MRILNFRRLLCRVIQQVKLPQEGMNLKINASKGLILMPYI